MPQLDNVTFISQWIYLLISFIVAYVFVLYFLIPKVVSVRKLRQKLNTLVTTKSHSFKNESNTMLYKSYDQLLDSNWWTCSQLNKSWPISARMFQISQALSVKKFLFIGSLIASQ